MKVCFQVEGDTDLVVFRRIVEVLLGTRVEPIVYERKTGGVDAALTTLTQSLHAGRAGGAEAAVVAVDANAKTPHDAHGADPGSCRYCAIRQHLTQRARRLLHEMFPVAVAVPVQAVEAWLLHVAHVIDVRPPGPHQQLDRRAAKRLLWGPDPYVDLPQRLEKLLAAMDAVTLQSLADAQPSFRTFRDEVLAWRSSTPLA